MGIKLSRLTYPLDFPAEATKRDIEIMNYILQPQNNKGSIPENALIMSNMERLWAVIQATKYIIKNNIEGDFVETGCWRGGNSLAIAMILNDFKIDKKIYLYDTFEGMVKPTKNDFDYRNIDPIEKYNLNQRKKHNEWCYASLEDVKSQFTKFDLEKNVVFIKGDILKTLNNKNNLPQKISLLKLGTVWYESIKHELKILYPNLSHQGVFLVDDYGARKGCQKAVNEFFYNNEQQRIPLMWRSDFFGRGFIKNY